MKILSITFCSSLKKHPPKLLLSDFSGTQSDLEQKWVSAVNDTSPIDLAKNIYRGRWIKSLLNTISSENNFYIVSAGVGLVCSDTKIPSYDCTIANGKINSLNVACEKKPNLQSWWRALCKTKYSHGLIYELAQEYDFILISLTSSYLKLILNDIEMTKKKIVLFTSPGLDFNYTNKNIFKTPYTNAFDGPLCPTKGLKADFAQRCHYDFIYRLKKYHNLEVAINSVKDDMKKWPNPPKINNKRLDDDQLTILIKQHINNFSSIRSLHKFFRHDLKIACEQKRFFILCAKVKG